MQEGVRHRDNLDHCLQLQGFLGRPIAISRIRLAFLESGQPHMHKAWDVQTICLVTKMPQNYTGLKKNFGNKIFLQKHSRSCLLLVSRKLIPTCLFYNPQSKGEFNHSFISPSIWASIDVYIFSSSGAAHIRITPCSIVSYMTSYF